jgi:hypothetical protein
VSRSPSTRSTPELLREWAAIMRELRARGVIRTNNNPVGDIAEAIVARHYGGERASFGQSGWDRVWVLARNAPPPGVGGGARSAGHQSRCASQHGGRGCGASIFAQPNRSSGKGMSKALMSTP